VVDFTLTDEQRSMREMAHDFAEKEIRPVAWEYDREGTWPGEVIEKAVASVYDDISDEKQARAYMHRKRLQKPENQKQAARIFRQLTRAGFASKTIFKILKQWNIDDETLTALEEEAES